MRVFVALNIDEEIRNQIQQFVEKVRGFAPDARWLTPDSLHITLKFIGEKPDNLVKTIEASLSSVTVPPFRIAFTGTGFFPTPRSARVFWIGIDAQPGLAQLASKAEDSLVSLGIPKEERAFSPHLTLARASGASGAPSRRKGDKPNLQFAQVQEHLTKFPPQDFGTMTAHEFYLYRSQVSSKGARYTKIARFALSSIS